MPVVNHDEEGDAFWAPGTLRVTHVTASTTQLLLHPVPSSDPDDPLNWTLSRKAINFGLVCFFILWTFVQLDIGYTAWEPMNTELGLSFDDLNIGAAINYGGLAVGCILFVPFVHKYGRRPLYIFSSTLQLASVIWQAKVQTFGDLIGSNLISGLGGAISETIVQITIADIFFVHQHGTMNGWYLMFTSVGAFLGPVASGYVVDSQGWRWMWWWCVIFMAINLVLVLIFYEESKYIPSFQEHSAWSVTESPGPIRSDSLRSDGEVLRPVKSNNAFEPMSITNSRPGIDKTKRPKPIRQRSTLSISPKGTIGHHFYQPVIVLVSFPAITFTALTYGTVLAAFAIMTSVQATYLLDPPYNFGAAGVGLMNLAPFIGSIFGFIFGGYLNDRSILWLSQRNRGIYEPEMRLWLLLIAPVLLPGSILLFGIGIVNGVHWSALAIAYGILGFNLVFIADIALSYITDCYQEIIADALVGITCIRNAFSLAALSALSPWIDAMGVQNVHILLAAVCFVVLLLPILLLIWGKKARIATAKKYRRMALRQPTHRTLD